MRQASCTLLSSVPADGRIERSLTTIPVPIPDRCAGEREVDKFRYLPLRIRPINFHHRIEELRLVFRSFRRPMISADGHREREIGLLGSDVSASQCGAQAFSLSRTG